MSPHSTRLTSARRSPIQFGRAVYTVEQVRLSAGLPPFTVLIDVGSCALQRRLQVAAIHFEEVERQKRGE